VDSKVLDDRRYNLWKLKTLPRVPAWRALLRMPRRRLLWYLRLLVLRRAL
jgi:hypothetical protein